MSSEVISSSGKPVLPEPCAPKNTKPNGIVAFVLSILASCALGFGVYDSINSITIAAISGGGLFGIASIVIFCCYYKCNGKKHVRSAVEEEAPPPLIDLMRLPVRDPIRQIRIPGGRSFNLTIHEQDEPCLQKFEPIWIDSPSGRLTLHISSKHVLHEILDSFKEKFHPDDDEEFEFAFVSSDNYAHDGDPTREPAQYIRKSSSYTFQGLIRISATVPRIIKRGEE